MKPAILAPIAFAIGVAGGTMLTKPPAPPPESVGDALHAESDLPEPPGTDLHAGSGSLTSEATPAVAASGDPSAGGTSPAAGPTPGFDAVRAATILSRLAPEDLAAIVASFNDADLEAVLRRLDAARVGAVIATMPKERGLALSRRLLAPGSPP